MAKIEKSDSRSGRIDPGDTSLLAAPQSDYIPEDQKRGFKVQWVSRESIRKYLAPQMIGEGTSGGIRKIPPWEVVRDESGIRSPFSMDAQGSPLDGALTRGTMVAIRIPLEYAAMYDAVLEESNKATERKMNKGAEQKGRGARMRAGTGPVDGDALPAYVRGVATEGSFASRE